MLCPFCGGEPEIIRLGTSKVSQIVGCKQCGCKLESNENGTKAEEDYEWNKRFELNKFIQ